MALPSGSFTDPRAGKLMVNFTGVWKKNGADQGGPSGGSGWYLQLRGYVGASGSDQYFCYLGVGQSSASIEVDYPGGNVAVPVGLQYVSHSIGGAGSVEATKLRVRCRLMKNK